MARTRVLALKRSSSKNMEPKKRRVEETEAYQPPAAKRIKSAPKAKSEIEEVITPFRFLDLPPELRNSVYSHLIHDDPCARLKSGKSKLFSGCAISRTNRQLPEEFVSLLHIAATNIVAEVTNFDFAHIVTFFNRLDDIDLEALPTATRNAERKMTIYLTVHQGMPRHRAKLQRWLNRLDHPSKKGANIKIGYAAEGTSYVLTNSLVRQLKPIANLVKNSGKAQKETIEDMKSAFRYARL